MESGHCYPHQTESSDGPTIPATACAAVAGPGECCCSCLRCRPHPHCCHCCCCYCHLIQEQPLCVVRSHPLLKEPARLNVLPLSIPAKLLPHFPHRPRPLPHRQGTNCWPVPVRSYRHGVAQQHRFRTRRRIRTASPVSCDPWTQRRGRVGRQAGVAAAPCLLLPLLLPVGPGGAKASLGSQNPW